MFSEYLFQILEAGSGYDKLEEVWSRPLILTVQQLPESLPPRPISSSMIHTNNTLVGTSYILYAGGMPLIRFGEPGARVSLYQTSQESANDRDGITLQAHSVLRMSLFPERFDE